MHKDTSNPELVRYAHCFPDLYEVGMSHLGSHILYDVINKEEGVFCERVYAPQVDMEEKMRENNIPLFGLESRESIRHFDIVAFTLQYELCYTNILNMLDLAGIPLLKEDRKEGDPFVLVGGSCAYNSEPMTDFIDAALLGCFPDLYEVGMSHLGSHILYDVINKEEGVFCERVYAPQVDMEEKMRENNIPLFGLESRESIRHFDIVAFTLQYELCYTNILNMLDLAGIPLLKEDRKEGDPFVLVGGSCAYNSEPMTDFIDAALLG